MQVDMRVDMCINKLTAMRVYVLVCSVQRVRAVCMDGWMVQGTAQHGMHDTQGSTTGWGGRMDHGWDGQGGEKLRVDASVWSMELERMAPLLKVRRSISDISKYRIYLGAAA